MTLRLTARARGALVVALALATSLVVSRGETQAPRPDIRIDYSNFAARVTSRKQSEGWRFGLVAMYALSGTGVRNGEPVRVRLMQGTRVAAEKDCPIDHSHGWVWQVCELPETLPTMEGMRLQITHINPASDGETQLHDAPLPVVAVSQWDGMNDGQPMHVTQYQTAADDLLGLATIRQIHTMRERGPSDAPGGIQIFFWVAKPTTEGIRGQYSARCRTGQGAWMGVSNFSGPGYELDMRAEHRVVAQMEPDMNVVTETVVWERMGFSLYDVPVTVESSRFTPRGSAWAAGRYSCEIRRDGNVMREVRFNVNARGQITPHPVQAGPDGVWVGQESVVADVFFPTPTEGMVRFDPAAIRGSYGLGRPWPNAAAMQEQMAALPAAQPFRFTPGLGARGAGRPSGGRRGGRGR